VGYNRLFYMAVFHLSHWWVESCSLSSSDSTTCTYLIGSCQSTSN
jgi:hypothetical protein